MSRVFIIQDQKYFDPDTREPVSKFDFSDALRYGKLVVLLTQRDSVLDLNIAITKLREGFKDFSHEDWILPTGNPIFIGIAMAIAARRANGLLRMLQWSGKTQCYIPITVENLYEQDIYQVT